MIKISKCKIAVPSLFVFGCISSYLLCFSRLGVDFTDCGFHIQCDYEIWNFHICLAPMWFFTNWVGGLWQALSPWGKNLQWLYIGGSVLWGLIGVFVFLILKAIFKLSDSILAFCVIGAFLSIPISQLDMLFQYYTFPLLLTMVYCFVFTRLVCHCDNLMPQAFLLGLIYILMIASRFPLILFCGIPIFYYLLRGFLKDEWTINRKIILCFCLGCFIGIAMATMLFANLSFNEIYTENHWRDAVIWVIANIRNNMSSWGMVFPLLAGCWVVSLFPATKKTLAAFVLLAFFFASAFFIALYKCPVAIKFMILGYQGFVLIGMAMVLIVGIFINNFFATWYFSKTDIKISAYDFLLLAITLFIVFLIYPLGTNTGALKNYYALFLLLAILNALLWSSILGNSRLKKTYPLLILLVLPLLGIASTLNYSYRESNKLHLRFEADIPALRNILTSNKDISAAYAGIKPHIKKGEVMLVTDNNFLWNWILDTKSFTTWIHYKSLEDVLKQSHIVLPDKILLIKKSSRNYPGYTEHLEWLRNSFLPTRYRNVYIDNYCELYRKVDFDNKNKSLD